MFLETHIAHLRLNFNQETKKDANFRSLILHFEMCTKNLIGDLKKN